MIFSGVEELLFLVLVLMGCVAFYFLFIKHDVVPPSHTIIPELDPAMKSAVRFDDKRTKAEPVTSDPEAEAKRKKKEAKLLKAAKYEIKKGESWATEADIMPQPDSPGKKKKIKKAATSIEPIEYQLNQETREDRMKREQGQVTAAAAEAAVKDWKKQIKEGWVVASNPKKERVKDVPVAADAAGTSSSDDAAEAPAPTSPPRERTARSPTRLEGLIRRMNASKGIKIADTNGVPGTKRIPFRTESVKPWQTLPPRPETDETNSIPMYGDEDVVIASGSGSSDNADDES